MARDILTTLYYPRRAQWRERAEMIDPGGRSAMSVAREVRRRAPGFRAVVLDGSEGLRGDPLAAVLLRRTRRRPPAILLSDCTWKLERGARSALRALDGPRTHYCVLTEAERIRFPRLWGVDAHRVHVTRWFYSLTPQEEGPTTVTDGLVFAGGDSLRDYGPLIAAARRLPQLRFVVAARSAPGAPRGSLPTNVEVGEVSHARFVELLRSAAAVVVPLEAREDRSAGQQTYLRAMALGKPTIVTDALGVREHVSDGVDGIVVAPGDADALERALRWATAPEHAAETRALGERARATVRTRDTADAYVAAICRAVDAALDVA